MPKKAFKKGDQIEVQIAANGVVTWEPATLLRWLSTTKMLVQYRILDETLPSPPPEDTVSVDAVRPAPPTELHRYFKVGEEVEGYCSETKRWRKSVIAEILENSAYAVVFEGERTPVKVERWWLRVVRRWIGGAWDPPFYLQEVLQKSPEMDVDSSGLKLKIKFSGNSSKKNFDEGMLVEIKGHEDGFQGSWYTAVVVEKLKNDKLLVEYQTLTTADKTEFVKEEVTICSVRPPPPSFEHIPPFDYFDPVDAWYNDGWWEGYVAKILSDGFYVIHFTHSVEGMIVTHSTLRPSQEWNDGKWSLAPKVNLIGESSRPSRVNQKRKYGRRSTVPKFNDGMMVEVKSDEEGYQGAWFRATIVSSVGEDSFLVQYQNLESDDESGLLRETTCASNIRPCPPILVRADGYKPLDEVDVWYNDGWWVGHVSTVLDELRYAVYFWSTNETLMFEHSFLRPHQEWIGGKWIVSRKKRSKIAKARLETIEEQNRGKGVRIEEQNIGTRVRAEFVNGMKVEVRSDQEGYVGSWYEATIVQPLGSDMFLVEYQTLVTDDEKEQLKEEAHSSCIRPCPPVVKKVYKYGEEVDAWYNDGWWTGRICEVLQGSRYMVYFSSTHERMALNRSALRPHQQWINGQWVVRC